MDYRGRRVLVTGPSGFLGTPLCEGLVRAGARVRALVRPRRAPSWLDRSEVSADVERVEGDVAEPERLQRALRGVELVFHLAARTSVPESVRQPEPTLQTNIVGTWNVLEAARRADSRLILASSSQVYGQATRSPIDEAHPLQANSPYAASKIAQEALVQAWSRSYGLPATVLRTFFTYGPRQSLASVVPTVICQLLDGPRVQLGNLYPQRDFVHVDDQVRGYLLAGASSGVDGRVINLAGPELVSIGGLVERVGALLGLRPEVVQDPERMRPRGSELASVAGDSSLAEALLGWRPEIGIDEGLERTVAWYREHRGLLAG
jgi:nucleoside-diphosphate-sugar epimerase